MFCRAESPQEKPSAPHVEMTAHHVWSAPFPLTGNLTKRKENGMSRSITELQTVSAAVKKLSKLLCTQIIETDFSIMYDTILAF